MQSNCIREASQACLSTCCVVNPLLLALPKPHSSPIKSGVGTAPDPHQAFCSAILSSIQPNSYFTNHESLPSLEEMLSGLQNVCQNYSNTFLADNIRAQEYQHLANHVCLDYTGHGLFSYSQLQGSVLSSDFASTSPSSTDAPFFDISYNSVNLNSYLLHGTQESEFQASVRKRITRHMNLLEEDYSLVFTTNQSSAFKLLADSYPFHSNQNLLTVYDYDNEAIQAMVESAEKRGARAQSAIFSWPDFRVNSRKLRKTIVRKSKPRNRGLFAFPLQSRMTGSRYSYQWMNLARENGWHVLLDACSLGAKDMETLGLSIFHPDFLICSFFKIFGHNPSGFCALIIKKSSIPILNPSATSIGIISINPAKDPFGKSTADETLEFQQTDDRSTSEIVEVEQNQNPQTAVMEFRCLDHADRLGLILISTRVRILVNWLVNALLSLRHPNSVTGLPLVRIYGPRIRIDRGPAVAFNVYDWKGERVDPALVQKLADRNGISLALGFLKNVWLSGNLREERGKQLETSGSADSGGKKKGRVGEREWGVRAASIAVGMLNDFGDAHRVWGFVARFLDADFVEKERWRYTALNQTTVEV